MFFHVRDLEVRAAQFDVELAPGKLDFSLDGDPVGGRKQHADQHHGEGTLLQKGPLKAQGKVELASVSLGEIRVAGRLTVEMEMECDRCLEPFAEPIETSFDLTYRPQEAGMGDEKEIPQDEAELGFYEGDGVELNDVLREQVLLALPMQRLCREDCKGICPECGQNRNQKSCECQPAAADDRWAALRGLK